MTAVVPEIRTAIAQVAAVGSNETIAIFNVREGDMILWMYAILLIQLGSGTTETTTIGDGDDVDGYGDNGDMDAEGTVGALITLAGPGVATATTHQVPKLYIADDTIDVTYVAGDAAGAAPKWKIIMGILPTSRA